MREIVVNGRFLSRRVTGVERYGWGLLDKLAGRIRIETTRFNGVGGHLWEQVVLPQKLTAQSILWSPANTGPVAVRNQVVTIHDLSPLEHPEWYRRSFMLWYRLLLPVLARRVRAIFTPSNYTRNRLQKKFAVSNVLVTPNGVDRSVFHPRARQERYDLPQNYILFVGTLEPRKNLPGLLQAWNEIHEEFSRTYLVIAGASGSVFGPLRLNGALERVLFLGYVDDTDLPGVYAAAKAFVLPSLEEGFGLPVLEAMACGTPVISSDGGALPEAVGDAGLIFSLSEPGGLSSSLRECLADDQLRSALREKGLARAERFAWHTAAERVWNMLHEI